MKIAFLVALRPDNNAFYGAELSLLHLLSGLSTIKEVDISIYVRDSNFNKRKLNENEKTIIKDFYQFKIKFLWLPYINMPFFKKKTIKSIIRNLYSKFVFYFTKDKLINELISFDYVHINNPELYYVSKYIQSSIHVRNYVYHQNDFIKYSTYFFCIDKATFDSVNLQNLVKRKILINPYNAKINTNLPEELKVIKNKYSKVYGIIGRIDTYKGVDYVIDEFIKINDRNACLLIVGSYKDKNYYSYCIKKANNHDNIIFLGTFSDMTSIYSILDYNIRGDNIYGIGRTVIESIHYGIPSFIPYSNDNNITFDWIDDDILKERFKNLVIFYKARNDNSLFNAISSLKTEKSNYCNYDSTIKYAQSFLDTLIQKKCK